MPDYSIVKIITAVTASIVLVALNIFFSTRKNPFFAFIMPLLSFLVSVVFLAVSVPQAISPDSSEAIVSVINNFLFLNIPTLVFIFTSLISRFLHNKL